MHDGDARPLLRPSPAVLRERGKDLLSYRSFQLFRRPVTLRIYASTLTAAAGAFALTGKMFDSRSRKKKLAAQFRHQPQRFGLTRSD
jgi:hypothetical protein